MMNAAEFEAKTGRKPEDDDLDRANCNKAGNVNHFTCGWCLPCDLPRFQCGHIVPWIHT